MDNIGLDPTKISRNSSMKDDGNNRLSIGANEFLEKLLTPK